MSPKQKSLYWREWAAVHKADPSIDRHALHIAALGKDKSSLAFTNEDLDKVLGQMRAISKPTSVEAQLRQLNQTKTRLLWKITMEQCTLLAVCLHPDISSAPPDLNASFKASAYILAIARDKFQVGRPVPRAPSDLRSTLEQLDPKQLEHLRSTLAQRINDLRRQKGHTIHQMRQLACLPCDCKQCGSRARAASAVPSESVPF